ncbi:membrane integrity-associated transporter subunit PqiC [bacterium]|nr:membrane integrity-associated transporter subunit PqiC [bacterium]
MRSTLALISKTSLIFCCLIIFCGCSSSLLGKTHEERLYRLATIKETTDRSQSNQAHDIILIISDATTSPSLSSQKILTQQSEQEEGSYQYARWVESPAKQLIGLVTNYLEQNNRVKAITTEAVLARGDYMLALEVQRFHHLLYTSPSKISVKVRAQLVNLKTHSIVSSKSFNLEEEVKSKSSKYAVEAFQTAVDKLVPQIWLWVSEVT